MKAKSKDDITKPVKGSNIDKRIGIAKGRLNSPADLDKDNAKIEVLFENTSLEDNSSSNH